MSTEKLDTVDTHRHRNTHMDTLTQRHTGYTDTRDTDTDTQTLTHRH